MGIEKVKEYFKTLGREGDVQEFDVSSATVDLAAQALGVEGARIAKTLSFMTPEGCVLVVAAGDAKVDNARYKAQFGCKAKMLSREECEAITGYAPGGVCPFCNPEGVRVFTDVSLQRFHTVFPSCGSSNSAIELSCDDLFSFSQSLGWIDVCKGWQGGEEK